MFPIGLVRADLLLHRFEEGFDVTSRISRLDTERNMVSPGHGSGPLAWRAASHPHPWTHTQTTRAGPAFGTFQRAQEKNKSAIQFSACDSALFWPLSRSLYRMKPSTVSRLFRSSFEKIATRLKSPSRSPFEKSFREVVPSRSPFNRKVPSVCSARARLVPPAPPRRERPCVVVDLARCVSAFGVGRLAPRRAHSQNPTSTLFHAHT